MEKKKAVRSTDVARLAGVSRSAVSRAFTPGAYVSDQTRHKVNEAAEALGYRPNAIARSLSKRTSGLIGIVISSLDNPFFARLLNTLSRLLQAEGYGVFLVVAESSNFDTLISGILSYQVDGAILATALLSSTSAFELQRYGKPVVLINRYLSQDVVSSVSGDNIGGSSMVADLFVAARHKRIAYLGGEEGTSSSRDRRQGFVDQLLKSGIALYAEETGHYSHDMGVIAARRLLSLMPAPDAIFCANDIMAMAVLDVARMEFQLNVPDDIAIVGYDNAGPVAWPMYQITTVDQNSDAMALMAIELLIRKLQSTDQRIEHLLVPATLIERATTRRSA